MKDFFRIDFKYLFPLFQASITKLSLMGRLFLFHTYDFKIPKFIGQQYYNDYEISKIDYESNS